MDTKVVEAGVKTNIFDEGLDMFYDPFFYKKDQALDLLQQFKTEIENDNLECSSFTPDVLSFSSSEHQFANRDDRPVNTFGKPTIWKNILTKIRDDIEKALGIRLNLCLADWHKDGHNGSLVNEYQQEDIDPDSSIIWMSFGPLRELLFTASEHPNKLSNLKKPKFSFYKFNLPSGSLLQMKPPINSFWSHELLVGRANMEKSLHILLKFSMTVEEKSSDDFAHFLNESSSSNARSLSVCSTISPETAKAIRLLSQLGSQDDE